MANGRLGSTTVSAYSAALVYSNTSGSAAAVNVQATDLSSTTNAIFSYAIDSATVSLNQTTTWTSISSGNVNYQLYWLDPVSGTTPVRNSFTSGSGNSGNYAGQYWDGSAWSTGSGISTSGNWLQAAKIDPYFYTNFSEYGGKTSPTFTIALCYPGQSNYAYVRQHNLATGITGLQLGKMLATADENTGATQVSSATVIYMGQGQDSDLYTGFSVGIGTAAYMSIWVPSIPGTYYSFTTNSIGYQFFGANNPASYTQYWYAPRVIASNGFFVFQATGYGFGNWAICDVETTLAAGSSPNYSFYSASYASGARWSGFNAAGSGYEICWFEWNPNTNKFYIADIRSASDFKIYSLTKAQIRAVQYGDAQYSNLSTVGTLESSSPAWGVTNRTTRPQRIGQSLWQVQSNNGNTYVSTDLINWTLSTTYWAAQGIPATTTCFAPVSSTSYLYASNGVANVNKFASGYSSVSQNATIEYLTPFSNYQRTGLVLSSGDKLYCQNFGTVTFSINVMGYEG